MKTVHVFPFVCVVACAPESVQVLTPRPAASVSPPSEAGANHAAEADERLRTATDLATHIEDILEEPVHMQGEGEPVHFGHDSDQ